MGGRGPILLGHSRRPARGFPGREGQGRAEGRGVCWVRGKPAFPIIKRMTGGKQTRPAPLGREGKLVERIRGPSRWVKTTVRNLCQLPSRSLCASGSRATAGSLSSEMPRTSIPASPSIPLHRRPSSFMRLRCCHSSILHRVCGGGTRLFFRSPCIQPISRGHWLHLQSLCSPPRPPSWSGCLHLLSSLLSPPYWVPCPYKCLQQSLPTGGQRDPVRTGAKARPAPAQSPPGAPTSFEVTAKVHWSLQGPA